LCKPYRGAILRQRLVGRTFLHSSTEVRDYLIHSMRDLTREILTVIFLDSSHAVLTTEVLAEGTINVNTIYPREIVKRALELNAAALIVAHNHPSGSLNPSPQDLHLTRTLALLCSMMHITLLDHFIIGDGAYSFADNGVMASIQDDIGRVMSQAISSAG
jgi:DNA repair protein RadC